MQKSHLTPKIIGISLLALVGSLASAAHAADAPAAPAATSDTPLPDIVVSAERTHTTLQKASLSVTAVTGDTLAKSNITQISGLNGEVPGLTVAASNGGERDISIRGIGLETPENPQTQSGVSYHIDGVYIFNSIAANAAFIDVGQIEVLRGPQGTMYGQGSTGGTINVVSLQPSTDKLSGFVDFGYGNYHYTKTDGALNVPISDTLAVRGAISFMKHDGYAHATDVPGQPNYPLSNANDLTGKFAVKWTPTDRLSVLLSTIQYRGDANAPEQKNVLDPAGDPRTVTQDYPGKDYIRTQLYYGVLKYGLDGVMVSSITSYQKMLSNQSWDGDGLNQTLFLADAGASDGGAAYDHIALWQQKTKSWTQELNVASDNHGPFKWIVGGVYLHSINASYINEYSGTSGDGLTAALPENTAWNAPGVASVFYGEESSITRESFAFYGQGTYKLTDSLSVTGGLRYNHDRYNGAGDSISNGEQHTSGSYLQPVPTVSDSTGKLTWKAAINYDVTPQNMVYFSYTRGYKPGGVNVSASTSGSYLTLGNPNGVQPTFKNETVDALEIGSKNRFLDNRLQFNAAAFYYFYKDMQFINDDPLLFNYGISNADLAHIYGLELEGDYRLADHLRLTGNLALEHGSYVTNDEALDGIKSSAAQVAAGYGGTSAFYENFYAAYLSRLAAYQNIKGNKVPKLPTVTANVAAEWSGDVGPGELLLRAQYTYRGKYNSDVFGSLVTPHYQQVNLFGNYAIKNSGVSVSATVTNLFNVAGISSRFADPYGVAHEVFNTYIPPRQFIATIKYAF